MAKSWLEETGGNRSRQGPQQWYSEQPGLRSKRGAKPKAVLGLLESVAIAIRDSMKRERPRG